jgi:Arc/MetJ-type ribon-helix-helix transcriptional regulator
VVERTGRSISALIRSAVERTYGRRDDVEDDVRAIGAALGAGRGREVDGEQYVARIRSGSRLPHVDAS